MMPAVFEGLIKVLFVFILASSAFIITQRHIRSLFTTYAVQSFFIAILALVLYTEGHEQTFIFIAIVTIISKVIIIPWFMRKIHKNMKIQRDIEFFKLTPVSSLAVSILLVLLCYPLVMKLSNEFSFSQTFKIGAVLGISLAFIGMLILFSRKQSITKIIGYLTMENGVLLFSLFFSELPFIVEILIMLDLVMLIMLVTLFAFGIDSTLDNFYEEFNFVDKWFGDKKR